ncbi:hypothetical protein LPJ61_003859 [Coemansia biformis]|uniref:Uncharacterized protein n=1 Tax=Coemansia biformis TaxID=1286918 RepID=A0A9W7YC76_9FUNG|nr:hypothetical protein LPJ61_003859 [Coemansia biformis]
MTCRPAALAAWLVRVRTVLVLLAVAIITTTAILLTDQPWRTHVRPPASTKPPLRDRWHPDNRLLDKLAIIFPVNNNTDMQFYRNTWFSDYLYPVCDWAEPGCKIVCNETSTYRTLDKKTFCFSREMKKYHDKEFFIKLDDDSFVDRDYVVSLMKAYTGWKRPVYISDHTRRGDRTNPSIDGILYGNGKFYMFNYRLVKCVDVDLKYKGSRNEDSVFGAMVRSGCGEPNVLYVQEDDDYIWHKSYKNKNKYIDLSYIKNH